MIKENCQIEEKRDKKKKKRMAGSPQQKKQHKISPKHNKDIRRYKKSRENSKQKSRENSK